MNAKAMNTVVVYTESGKACYLSLQSGGLRVMLGFKDKSDLEEFAKDILTMSLEPTLKGEIVNMDSVEISASRAENVETILYRKFPKIRL